MLKTSIVVLPLMVQIDDQSRALDLETEGAPKPSFIELVVPLVVPTPAFLSAIAGVVCVVIAFAVAPTWCVGGGFEFVLLGFGVVFFGLAIALLGSVPALFAGLGVATILWIIGGILLSSNSCVG